MMLGTSKTELPGCAVQIWRTGQKGPGKRRHIPLASKVIEAAAIEGSALRGLSVALQLAINGLC